MQIVWKIEGFSAEMERNWIFKYFIFQKYYRLIFGLSEGTNSTGTREHFCQF